MKISEYTPIEQLKPFIKAYRIIESEEALVNRVVPNTSFTIAFRLRGQISYISDIGRIILPAATFSGLRKSVRLINYAPESATIVILFREAGVSAFFKQPLHDLFEESVSLDNYFPVSEISMIEEYLAITKNNAEKIAVVERFLSSKLIYNNPDSLVLDAIGRIHAAKGNIKIKELARYLYISQDAFEKRFRKTIGATPKQFSSIVKMNEVIRQTSQSPTLLDIVFENGFYDQAHFNKNFKIFTGQTPTDFFKLGSYW